MVISTLLIGVIFVYSCGVSEGIRRIKIEVSHPVFTGDNSSGHGKDHSKTNTGNGQQDNHSTEQTLQVKGSGVRNTNNKHGN